MMGINKLVFGTLVAGCLAAAGGGAYLAVRHNAADAGPRPSDLALGAATSTPATPTRPEADAQALTFAPDAAAAPTPALAAPTAPDTTSRETSAVRPDQRSAAARRAVPTRAVAAAVAPVQDSVQTATSTPSAADTPSAPIQPLLPPPSDAALWEARPGVSPDPAQGMASAAPAEFVDLVIPMGAVIGLQVDRTVDSASAQLEDAVSAHVSRDVLVDGQVAVPAGARAEGTVMDVARPRRMGGRSRLTVRFHTVVMPDGSRVSLRTEPIVREGSAATASNAAKVGGAAMGGTILGAILGGRKGAMIGGALGAGGGAAAVMASERDSVTIPGGTVVNVRVQESVPVTITRDHER